MGRRIFLAGLVIILITALISEAKSQWVPTNGPLGCSAECFVAQGPNLFVGTGDGVSITTDSGANWRTVNNGLDGAKVDALTVAGTNLFAASYAHGVFVSTNNGANWSTVIAGLPNLKINALAVSGSSLFAALDGGFVCRSTNKGVSWESTRVSKAGYAVLALAVTRLRIFACTFGDGTFVSTDGGTSWSAIISSNGYPIETSLGVHGNNLLEGYRINYVQGAGVRLSTDNGLNWNSSDFGSAVTSAFTSIGPIVLAGTNSGVRYSTDNGTTWQRPDSNLSEYNVFALATIGTSVFAGTNGGVFISTDSGLSWRSTNNGLRTSDVSALAANQITPHMVFAGTYGGGLQRFDGTNWIPVGPKVTGPLVNAVALSGSNIFAGAGGAVYRSTDNGVDWNTRDTFLDYEVRAIVLNGTTIYAATGSLFSEGFAGGSVWRSDNSGRSWIRTNTNDDYWNALAFNGGDIFAGGSSSPTSQPGIFFSSDQGADWTAINNGLNYPSVLALTTTGGSLFASTLDTVPCVFLSTNNGTTWISANGGLKNIYVNAFATIGKYIFAGTSAGIYLSSNNGTIWNEVNTGLEPNSYVTSLSASNTTLYAGTDGHGVWSRPLSDFGLATVSFVSPAKGTITSFPNPFVKSTTIRFSSSDRGPAQITVINMLGSEVAKVFSGDLEAGEHSFKWDANTLPPGMYWCSVHVNGQTVQLPVARVR